MALIYVETEEFNHKEPEYLPIEAEPAQVSAEKIWWSTEEYHDHPSLLMRLFKKGNHTA